MSDRFLMRPPMSSKVPPNPTGRSNRSQVLMDMAPGELLRDLDRAVKLYEIESETALAELVRIQLYLVALLLGVLIIEGVFIFRLLVVKLRRQDDQLERLAHTNAPIRRCAGLKRQGAVRCCRLMIITDPLSD